MSTWWKRVPEWECVTNGDPYLIDIVRADDTIDDHRYHAEDLGIDAATAVRIVDFVERQRLSYELAALYAWWSL
jgi:hypothetical protein